MGVGVSVGVSVGIDSVGGHVCVTVSRPVGKGGFEGVRANPLEPPLAYGPGNSDTNMSPHCRLRQCNSTTRSSPAGAVLPESAMGLQLQE